MCELERERDRVSLNCVCVFANNEEDDDEGARVSFFCRLLIVRKMNAFGYFAV